MINHIIFDTDGVVIRRDMYFSARLSKDFGVAPEKVLPFFKNEFRQCLIGRADVKEELKKYVSSWNWTGTVEQLLEYWFRNESILDERVLKTVASLQDAGLHCYLDTNNEKYRTEYLREKLGLGNIFDAIFSSSSLGHAKPTIEFWEGIHNQLGHPEQSTVLVWDDEDDTVSSARQFGFQAEFYSGYEDFRKNIQARFNLA